jgi:hypothetical protein
VEDEFVEELKGYVLLSKYDKGEKILDFLSGPLEHDLWIATSNVLNRRMHRDILAVQLYWGWSD